jgi:hypothetical protein
VKENARVAKLLPFINFSKHAIVTVHGGNTASGGVRSESGAGASDF